MELFWSPAVAAGGTGRKWEGAENG
jgi:hypothetical protein